MEKGESAKEITEGINDSVAAFVKQVLYGILGAGAILTVIICVLVILAPTNPGQVTADLPTACDKPYVQCHAIEKGTELVSSPSMRYCGYSEALAWFQIYEASVDIDLELHCSSCVA